MPRIACSPRPGTRSHWTRRARPDPQPDAQPERAGLEDYARALEWFRAEHHALVGAVALAERDGFDAHAWQIPWTMVTFFDLEGHWHDAVRVQETALAAAEAAR